MGSEEFAETPLSFASGLRTIQLKSSLRALQSGYAEIATLEISDRLRAVSTPELVHAGNRGRCVEKKRKNCLLTVARVEIQ